MWSKTYLWKLDVGDLALYVGVDSLLSINLFCIIGEFANTEYPVGGRRLSISLKDWFYSNLLVNPFPSTLPVNTGENAYLKAKHESGSILPFIVLVFNG